MNLLRLLLFSVALVPAASSPIAAHRRDDEAQLRAELPGAQPTPAPVLVQPGTPRTPPTPDSSRAPRTAGFPDGTPMKPLAGRDVIRVAPTMPAQLATKSLIPIPVPQGCTTTLSIPNKSPCAWDGTLTQYPSATMLYTQVDCHGCDNIHVVQDWYYCPNMRVNKTERATTPQTYYSTVCLPVFTFREHAADETALTVAATPLAESLEVRAPVPLPSPVITAFPTAVAEPARRRARHPQDASHLILAPAACPTTYVVQPEQSAGKTMTRYSRFTTTTVSLNCGGCPLVISTALAGYGPVGQFTTTTTLPVGTSTTYACTP